MLFSMAGAATPNAARTVLAALLMTAAGAASVAAQDLTALFTRVAPSVVTIRAHGQELSAKSGLAAFKEIGSGVLISKGGKVVTAAHVVHTMDDVTVEFASGESIRAHVIASEPSADLSLLQTERVPPKAAIAVLGDSDKVRVGQQVIVVGAPYGLGRTMSVGWIGGRHAPRALDAGFRLAEFFQTDAAINTGNSGGPMFDLDGKVVGVVSHMISKSGGSEGLGFVVTAKTVRALLLEGHAYWTGAEFYSLSGDLAGVFNLPQPAGLLVKALAKGSPLAEAGVQAGSIAASINGESMVLGGDVILAVAGVTIQSPDDVAKIRERLRATAGGTAVPLKLLRAGRVLDVTVALRPAK